MGESIWQELKQKVFYSGNSLYHLLAINIIVFLVIALPLVFLRLFNIVWPYSFVQEWFFLPLGIKTLLFRPWTLISYQFLHQLTGIAHLFFNMLILYFFGRIFHEYLGSKKLVAVYILGGLAGAGFYQLMNLFPMFAEHGGHLVGASASILAILVATATLLPDYTLFLIFLGPVKLKWIALFLIIIYTLSLVGDNAGGNFAHLGGAFMGMLYITQMKKGRDLGQWVTRTLEFLKALFFPATKPTLRVHVNHSSTGDNKLNSKKGAVSEAEVNAILDKVHKSGYDSLSKREKEILFNASNQ